MYGNKLLARAQAMIKDKMVPEEPIVAASQPVYVRAKTLQAISIAKRCCGPNHFVRNYLHQHGWLHTSSMQRSVMLLWMQ